MAPYDKKANNGYAGRTTQKAIAAFSLDDQPTNPSEGFIGYFRNQDPTTLPPNALTFPSINCFIPNKDKIVPREGTTLLGQAYTTDENWPIVGHKKRFATMGGLEVEVRVVKTDDANLRDIVEVYAPIYAAGVETGSFQWYRITQSTNPLAVGLHRYYMDDWFDTNLNPALSLKLSRLIWVNGLSTIFSWTGGIAPIVSIVGSTISTTVGVTWASLGFVDPSIDPSSSGNIVINGTLYVVTGGWSTNTLTLTTVAGISVNDVAFSKIQADTSPTAPNVPFDVVRNNKNYMFYGNWNSRNLFMSNGFNRPATSDISTVRAVQDDLVLGTSPYTGTGQHTYRVTISAVEPPVNEQTYTATGPNGLNDAAFDTSGYPDNSGLNGELNVYKVLVVANYNIFTLSGSGLGFFEGETIAGSSSGALGRYIVEALVPPSGANSNHGIELIFGQFEIGETVTGQMSGATMVIENATYGDWVQYFKNNVPTIITFAGLSQYTVPIGIQLANIPLSDGLAISFLNESGHQIGDFWQLTINQNGHDSFIWQIDDGVINGPVAITGGNQTLSNGVVIKFVSKTGHTLGDTWNILVNQAIAPSALGAGGAWTSFYYTLPIRRPGEGYVYQLPSNFWTMAPQETEMYVNTKFGKWSYIETVLSADLQSETVLLTPLKQVSSSKVLFPYMIGYLDDTLIYVTENKTLDMIGRKELLQLPQTTNLSQPVALDFQELTFEDGSMEYLGKRLYITSPKQSTMLVYDNQPDNKYWQPPQVIPENGILSIIGNTLITHSNLRNQSFNLFTGKSGDISRNYTVRARSPYLSYGNRWGWKNSNMSFVEGYVTGAPPMKMNIYLGINGCAGLRPHDIEPIICLSPDQAPFGEGNFGSHQNGSDRFNQDSHFNEIYERYMPILQFRFASIELECTATNHSYSWLSYGLNAVVGNKNNIDLKNREIISRD